MKRWKVLITAPRAAEAIERYEDELGAAGCHVIVASFLERLEEPVLLSLVHDIDAIICSHDRLSKRVLDAAPRLRVISKWGTGIDSIDVENARRRRITVSNTPAAFSDAVGDTALGYVLLFVRKPDLMSMEMKAGVWRRFQLKSMRECTLGIIGFSNSGRAVARRATGFGMRILSCTLNEPTREELSGLNIELVSMEDLLALSDFVTLHADLRPDNRHLIDENGLRLMKQNAVLINAARGELVDEDALIIALREQRIAGAALDVFKVEPLPKESPLRQLENVYLAPHNPNASVAAAERVHVSSIRNVLRVLEAEAHSRTDRL